MKPPRQCYIVLNDWSSLTVVRNGFIKNAEIYLTLILRRNRVALGINIVFEVIRTISGLLSFFHKKTFSIQKHVTSKKQLTKQNWANTNQQRQQFFAQKLLRGWKPFVLRLVLFLCWKSLLKKKNKEVQNCPDNLKYNTTEV